MDERSRHLAAARGLVATTPAAVWAFVGDLSETGTDLDYVVRVPQLPRLVELALGVVALTVMVRCAVVLGRALHHGQVRRQWSATVVPLCVAGALAGLGGRLLTAGGYGVDLGAVMFVVLGLPIVVLLVTAAGANAWWESRR